MEKQSIAQKLNKPMHLSLGKAVLGAGILLVAVVFVIQHQSESPKSTSKSILPTPIVTEYPLFPKPTDNPSLTSWRTFVSKTVGYTFKAPADWNVQYREADKKKGYGQFDYNFVFTPKTLGGRQPSPDDDNFATVEIQFPGNYEATHINSESVKTTIEGRTTYITKSTSPLHPPADFRGSWCGGCSEKDVYIEVGYSSIRLPIVARWNKGVMGFEKTFDQMIATIHFTHSIFIWDWSRIPGLYIYY